MDLLRLLSASEIIAQIISFLILFFLLRAFAWKKILKILDDRRERITNEFKQIEDTKIEVEKLKSDYSNKLSTIDEAASGAIRAATKEGILIAESIKKQAYFDAEKIMENAKSQIVHEISKVKEEIKNEIIDLTIEATEKIVKEKMNDDRDKKLVADFIERLDQVK